MTDEGMMTMALDTTIYDIAKEAGVAPSTVSRVLSGHPSVSAKTKEKVEGIAKRRHFATAAAAREFEKLSSRTLALIMPEMRDYYHGLIAAAANREAQMRGYETMLFQLPVGEEYSMTEVANRVLYRRLGGALFAGGVPEAERPDTKEALNRILEAMPLVCVAPPIEGVNCTFFHNDLETAMFQAVSHLRMLGHRRVAFIGGNRTVENSGARARGYLRAVRELNLIDDPDYRCAASGVTPEAGEIAVARMLSNIGRDRWPTAIMAFNDPVALGALKQLSAMRLRVPQDMAIIGCDNTFFSAYTNPPLSTIDMHSEERARTAIDELVSCSNTPRAPFTLVRAPTLIIRESCGTNLGYRKLG